jgi:(1->4)-alpha-D-glucan 1-alpha-D-glucosylmutase
VKITAPGIPDIYQGIEVWDFSLVDPDNRQPVDFAHRAAPDLFRLGEYVPVQGEGKDAEHLCAVARRRESCTALTVVPRLTARLTDQGPWLPLGEGVWCDTWLALPGLLPAGSYLNLFTGALVKAFQHGSQRALVAGELIAEFPVALLVAPPARIEHGAVD